MKKQYVVKASSDSKSRASRYIKSSDDDKDKVAEAKDSAWDIMYDHLYTIFNYGFEDALPEYSDFEEDFEDNELLIDYLYSALYYLIGICKEKPDIKA